MVTKSSGSVLTLLFSLFLQRLVSRPLLVVETDTQIGKWQSLARITFAGN